MRSRLSSGCAGVRHHDGARAGSGEIRDDVEIRAVHAQHELGPGGNGGADLADVEAVDAHAHAGRDELADDVAEGGERQSGRAADVDDVRAGLAEVLGRSTRLVTREARNVVDLGDDLDVPRAVVAR